MRTLGERSQTTDILTFSVGESRKHSLHNRTSPLGLENVLLMLSECSYLVPYN